MKKVKLDVDSLAVESFETGGDGQARGTVQGRGISNERCNSDVSCADTCYFLSCNPSDCGKCVDTYDGTCDIYCTASAGTSCNEPCQTCMASYCPSNCTNEPDCTQLGYC